MVFAKYRFCCPANTRISFSSWRWSLVEVWKGRFSHLLIMQQGSRGIVDVPQPWSESLLFLNIIFERCLLRYRGLQFFAFRRRSIGDSLNFDFYGRGQVVGHSPPALHFVAFQFHRFCFGHDFDWTSRFFCEYSSKSMYFFSLVILIEGT